MSTDSSAAAILAVTEDAIWPRLLASKLSPVKAQEINTLYLWGERDYALEQMLMHTPARWLPPGFANWNDFLASVVIDALGHAQAPGDLAKWHYGSFHTVDVEHAIFAQSDALRYLLAKPTGTGPRPQSGDRTTVKQVGHSFGPSERFTADFADLNRSTLNLVLGQSGNPDSAYFMDQFPAWYQGTTFPIASPTAHTLTLQPR